MNTNAFTISSSFVSPLVLFVVLNACMYALESMSLTYGGYGGYFLGCCLLGFSTTTYLHCRWCLME